MYEEVSTGRIILSIASEEVIGGERIIILSFLEEDCLRIIIAILL